MEKNPINCLATADTGFNEEMSARAARSIGHVRSTFHAIEAATSEDIPPSNEPPPPPTNIFANNTIDTPLLLNHLSSIHSQALSWGQFRKTLLNSLDFCRTDGSLGTQRAHWRDVNL